MKKTIGLILGVASLAVASSASAQQPMSVVGPPAYARPPQHHGGHGGQRQHFYGGGQQYRGNQGMQQRHYGGQRQYGGQQFRGGGSYTITRTITIYRRSTLGQGQSSFGGGMPNRYERHYQRGGSSPYAGVPGAHRHGHHQRPPIDYGLRVPRETRGHDYLYQGYRPPQRPMYPQYGAPRHHSSQPSARYCGWKVLPAGCNCQWKGNTDYVDCSTRGHMRPY